MSFSASKIRDGKSSIRRDNAFKNRRSESVDYRARGSYVPEKKRSSSEDRKSGNSGFNRWSGARKSSLNLGDVKRKDVRPLTDKAYQKRKIADLVAFLEEVDFKYPINASKLISPSKKDFETIFQFLYSFFDPMYEVKKLEEEAPKILKNLGYPFTVNKSAFVYVARTNWPNLLGILIWLMDLNKFAIVVNINSLFEGDSGSDERTQIHRILLRYIYQSYYSGTDNPEEDEEIYKNIVKSLIPEDVDELFEINKKKFQQLSDIEQELEEIKSLSAQKVNIDIGIEKYEKYFVQMKAHIEKNKGSRELIEDKLKLKESQLRALKDQIAVKQEAYDAQGFDGKKQLSYFESQKKDLIEKLDKKQAVTKELQDKVWEAEIQLQQNLDKVNDALDSFHELYNKTVEDAKFVLEPIQNVKNPQIQKLYSAYQINFPAWEVPPHTGCSDWKLSHESIVESVSHTIKNAIEMFQRVSSSQSEKLNETQLKKSEMSVQLKLLSIRESQKESDINSKEKQAVDEISLLESQCEKVMKSVAALQTERLKLEKTKEMVDELNLLRAFREQREKEYNEYVSKQIKAFSNLLKTEQEVDDKLLEYGNEILQKLEHDLM